MKNILSKVKEMIKKHDNICVFIILIVLLIIYLLTCKIYVGDELWLFSFIYKYINGCNLYKDLNIITTPLFYFVGKIVFSIFGDNYISIRIYGALIFSTLFLLIYILYKKMKCSKLKSFFCTIMMYCIFNITAAFSVGASYNYLSILLVVGAIILELVCKKDNTKSILRGINIFCVFMTKQNIAILYGCAILIIDIIKIKRNEIVLKTAIKNIIITTVSFMIPSIIFIIYLALNNMFVNFVSYCILGMKEFGLRNGKIGITALPIVVTYVIGIITSFLLIRKKDIDPEVVSINRFFIPIEIVMGLSVYPILDKYHMLVGATITLIILIYNIQYLIFDELKDKEKLTKIMKRSVILMCIYIICYSGIRVCRYTISNTSKYSIKPYVGMKVDSELKEKTIVISNYIKENDKRNIDTKIISGDAVLYMNVVQKNNNEIDMPFLGNLGKEGENGLLSQIMNLKSGTKILIKKKKLCWQESDKIRNCIMSELKQIGEIEDFYIYER